MQADTASGPDWRDAAAYASLLEADRSLFAWEWLRRDPGYRRAAARALAQDTGEARDDPVAAEFGLVRFEDPNLGVPKARPLWRSEVDPYVLAVRRGSGTRAGDAFAPGRLGDLATVVQTEGTEHLLLSDGLRALRLDGPVGLFSVGPACLRYSLEGLVTAEPPVMTLRRFLALCRTHRFGRSLHRPEPRARRWILMLRAWDGLSAGAGQREIAAVLLSRSVAQARWRSREPSVRSQVQRLVGGARQMAMGGYRRLLLP